MTQRAVPIKFAPFDMIRMYFLPNGFVAHRCFFAVFRSLRIFGFSESLFTGRWGCVPLCSSVPKEISSIYIIILTLSIIFIPLLAGAAFMLFRETKVQLVVEVLERTAGYLTSFFLSVDVSCQFLYSFLIPLPVNLWEIKKKTSFWFPWHCPWY